MPYARIAPGAFTVSRVEQHMDEALTVHLDYSGTASRDDYGKLPNAVVIPAGTNSVQVFVIAKSDDLMEGTETVVARIVPIAVDSFEQTRDYQVNLERAQAQVQIHDEDQQNTVLPVVSLTTVRAITKEPRPTELVAPGVFRLERSGSTTTELPVFLKYSGTATPDVDYAALPDVVTIEKGSAHKDLTVFAPDDGIVEQTETVYAELIQPPTAGAALMYQIHPADNSGTIEIRDRDHFLRPILRITQPDNGAILPEGRPIQIAAVAVDPHGYIPRVEFYEGDRLLGFSEIAFIQPPPDGTPISHEFTWNNAPVGRHVLTAQAVDSSGNRLVSDEVKIVVGTNDGPARIEITHPDNGDFFRSGTPIKVEAVAVDPEGYIPRVEFYAAERLIGVSEIAFIHPPPDGTPITHTMVWNNAPAGEHTLLARALNSNDNPVSSAPITIVVGENDEIPIVSIKGTDPIATEVPINSDAMDFATFEITRTGSLDQELVVFFSLHGTARVNADYNFVGESVRIAPGQSSATITIIPILDGITVVEPMETVAVRLEYPPKDGNYPVYGIAESQDTAGAVIFEGQPPAGGSIVFATPTARDELALNEEVAILVAAYHPTLEIVHLEFLLDGQLIGRSDLDVPAGMGQLFFHRLEWKAAPLGEHVLTARGLLPDLQSETLLVTIGAGSEAHIAITKPRDGEVFPLGTPIEIEAVAVDPDGYIPRLEFYSNDQRIGVSEITFIRAPDPGTPIHHSLVWSNAPSGRHQLTARGVDSNGKRVTSNPVTITVTGEIHKRVVVAIEASDASATENPANGARDPAVFVISRIAGPTDVPVSIFYDVTGTAQNGNDYERLGGVTQLNAGQLITEILVRPIPDPMPEGEESVVITLREPNCRLLPFVECYQIGSPSQARTFIRDGEGTNLPPRVAIHRPRDGAVFESGQPVVIFVEGSDPDGSVEQIELYANDRLLWRTNVPSFTYSWLNPGQGRHTLMARILDDSGVSGESSPVRILVDDTTIAFAERDLPESYVPGATLTVSVNVHPPLGTRLWALEDQPPRGWTVNEISDGGVFDPATRKVKFGPFNDTGVRRLNYRVTPPIGATGEEEFTGTASADGRAFRIVGDQLIRTGAMEHHPADSNEDNRIVLVEVTAYSAAWKGNSNPAVSPDRIPMSYATRAAMIWRLGEAYHFDASQPAPFCWVPDAQSPLSAAVATSAIRTVPSQFDAGDPLTITVEVRPTTGTGAYAIEEKVPPGWTAGDLSDDGVFDPETSSIRWGVFVDSHARILRYTLTAPPGVTSIGKVRGDLSFDGKTQPIEGSARVAVEGSIPLHMPNSARRPDGKLQLTLSGAPGQLCILESSSDLSHWVIVDELFLPDGHLDVVDDPRTADRRYYRLRTR